MVENETRKKLNGKEEDTKAKMTSRKSNRVDIHELMNLHAGHEKSYFSKI